MSGDNFDDYEQVAKIVHDLAEVDVLERFNGVCPFCHGMTYDGLRNGVRERVQNHSADCEIGRAKEWRRANITSV